MNTAANTQEDDVEEGSDSELTLVFTAEGGAVLEEQGEPVWFSDADDDFQTEFQDAFLEPDQDSKAILNYLEEEGWLETEEKERVKIEVEDETGEVIE